MSPPHGLSDEEFRRRMDAYEKQAADIIAEHGVFLQGVFGENEPEPKPGFTYTVGLSLLEDTRQKPNHPELIVFGLPHEVAGSYLNHLAIHLVIEEGARLEPGPMPGLFNEDPPLDGWLLEVIDPTEHLTLAQRFSQYPDPPVPALQLVFPDDQNRLPWVDGYNVDPRVQPLLGQPPS